MNIKRYIGDKAFYKNAMKIAVPILIQNGITNFVALLDNIMVGSVGTVQMAGVAIANTLMFVFNLTVFGAMAGAGIFSAQYHGSNDDEGVKHTMRYKLIAGAALAVLGMLFFTFFGNHLINLYLTGEGNIEDIEASLNYGHRYIMIILISIPAFIFSQCYSSTMRETGRAVVPMISGLIAVGVNLFFNWVLIYGHFGAPALGSDGAAWATVIARYVEALIVVIWTHSNRDKFPYAKGLYRSSYIPKKLIRDITVKGMPLLFNEALWSGGVALLNQCYSIRGYNVVAAINISSTLTNLCNVVFLAMGISIGIIVGQILGSGDIEKAKDTDRKLITFGMVICIIPMAVLLLLSGIFPKLYETTDDIRSLATSFMIMCACLMPASSFANSVYFTLRCGGKTFITILFDSVFTCAIVVPVAFVLSRFTTLDILPLFFICQSLEVIKCIVGAIMLKSGIWINNLVDTAKA